MPDATVLEELEQYDTPSISNIVATYPDDPLCLGLYNPWTENWYTDQTISCMYPDIGPRVGHVVTCVYGIPDPNYDRLSFMDVTDAIGQSASPTIVALEQRFPPDIAAKVGLTGGNMTSAMKALGCVGCVSNGPARDIDEIRSMEFQYLVTGISPAHGDMAVHAVNVPVSICGMDVAPGEIIHMDENGAVKFPASRAADVLENVERLIEREGDLQSRISDATDAASIRRAFSGDQYGSEEK